LSCPYRRPGLEHFAAADTLAGHREQFAHAAVRAGLRLGQLVRVLQLVSEHGGARVRREAAEERHPHVAMRADARHKLRCAGDAGRHPLARVDVDNQVGPFEPIDERTHEGRSLAAAFE
jgi:hypothetical protein